MTFDQIRHRLTITPTGAPAYFLGFGYAEVGNLRARVSPIWVYRRRKMKHARRLLTLAILGLYCLSCATGVKPKRFHSQEEAGSIAVSIQSIAPFDEQYIEQLQPKVEMPAARGGSTRRRYGRS